MLGAGVMLQALAWHIHHRSGGWACLGSGELAFLNSQSNSGRLLLTNAFSWHNQQKHTPKLKASR
jgi:hypothetical protein